MASRVGSVVLLCSALAVGCGSAGSPALTGGSQAAATPSAPPAAASPIASSQVSPAINASPTAADAEIRLDLARAPTVLDPSFPVVLITLPDTWTGLGGWAFHRASQVAVQFWNVDQVYGHPCQWKGTLMRPGPTVDDLVKALVGRPLRNASKPVDVTLAGYRGRYLEWSVPSDADFSTCDTDGGTHYFESWTAYGGGGDRYHQGPGQVDRLWILDVKGSRVVIDAFVMPTATAEMKAELAAVVGSIRFEP